MKTIMVILQITAALGLLNVWLLRYKQPTQYRGRDAGSMQEEFAAYGLPAWLTYVIGALKVGSALALIAGIWMPAVVFPAAALVGVLMVGALAMHAKVRDPLKKSVPALCMLVLCLVIAWSATR